VGGPAGDASDGEQRCVGVQAPDPRERTECEVDVGLMWELAADFLDERVDECQRATVDGTDRVHQGNESRVDAAVDLVAESGDHLTSGAYLGDRVRWAFIGAALGVLETPH
jgi:hypothetical protein